MLFNSYIFIFLFFPLCLAGFYLLEHYGKGEAAKLWLTGFSLWFYGYFNLYYLAIMLGSIAGNYCVAQLLWRSGEACGTVSYGVNSGGATGGAGHAARRRAVLVFGVCANLAVLGYFKYYDFFVENCNAVFGTDILLRHVLLPLGISFFTFQQIGFLADVYRGEARLVGLTEYALFVSFFPQLVAGPIVNYAEMMPQFARIGRRKFQAEQFTKGVYLFTLGLAKKVLVADTFGQAVEYGFGNVAALSGTDALLTMLCYTLQLYFDFSGYCDMARGLGHMMGIEIPVNFDSPYKAADIEGFWKRWHITLNRFLMRYVYIPLGGNRKGQVRMYRNLLLVFLVSGLWHGAGWTFVVWGMLHGILYVVTRLVKRRTAGEKSGTAGKMQSGETAQAAAKKAGIVRGTGAVRHVLGVAGTFLFVNIAWVFFRAENLGQAFALLGRMAAGGYGLPAPGIYEAFHLDEFWYVLKVAGLTKLPGAELYLCAGSLLAALCVVFFHKNAGEMAETFRPNAANMLGTAVLFLWCVLSLSGVSTFLYFNF